MANLKIDDKALQLISDFYEIGGGAQVVTELPEVGEEHTIYELQETSKGSYGWVFREIPTTNILSSLFLVFDTYEQMTSTFNVITATKEGQQFHIYIRNENKMYYVLFENQEEGDPRWIFIEEQKKEDPSGTEYAFQLTTLKDYQTFYILKEFVGDERPIIDGGYAYTYLTLDNKEVYIGDGGCGYILSDIVHPNEVTALDFIIMGEPIISNTLPTSVELETNYYNLLRATWAYVVCYSTSDNKYYSLIESTHNYYWFNNEEDREDCYFAQSGEYEGDPLHYEGELEWKEIEDFDSLPKFNDIPYNDIINGSGRGLNWIFQPSKAGEVTTSYWIYTNDKWVNIDEIPDPNLIKIGVTCDNGNWDVLTLPLNTITVTYDGVDYRVTQYAKTEVPTEQGTNVTYYGYIEVPMPTQNNLTHTFKVSTTESPTNWSYSISVNDSNSLNSKYTLEGNGILVISIYYDNNA